MAGKPKTIWSQETISHLKTNYAADTDSGDIYHITDNKSYWCAGDRQITHTDAHGYVGFNITLPSGKRMRLKVHQVIMFFILGHQSTAPLIDHKDGNRQNNRGDNLREATDQENSLNRVDNTLDGQYKAVAHSHRGTWMLYRVNGDSGKWKHIKGGFLSAGVALAYARQLESISHATTVIIT